jgi:hypothetical protein
MIHISNESEIKRFSNHAVETTPHKLPHCLTPQAYTFCKPSRLTMRMSLPCVSIRPRF